MIGKKLLSLTYILSIIFAGCSSGSSGSESFSPVKVTFQTGGVPPPSELYAIKDFNIHISGCSVFEEKDFWLSAENNKNILNVYTGDTSCTASINSIVIILPTGITDTLTLQTGKVFSNTQSNLYVGATTGYSMQISLQMGLNSPIAATENLIFTYAPVASSKIQVWSESSLLPAESTELYPAFIPQDPEVTSTKVDNGKELVLNFQCIEPLILWKCKGVDIYAYRFKVIPNPAVPFTYAEMLTEMQKTDNLVRGNIGILAGNGFKLMLAIPAGTDGELPDLLAIAKLENNLQTFVIKKSKVIQP